MATAKARRSVIAAIDPRDADTQSAPRTQIETTDDAQQEDEASDQVLVTIPKAFNLTGDLGEVTRYEIGTREIPRAHAEHWYAEAHGVKIK